jgi:hypothetical protein
MQHGDIEAMSGLIFFSFGGFTDAPVCWRKPVLLNNFSPLGHLNK